MAGQANETDLAIGLNEKGETFRVLGQKVQGKSQYEHLSDLGTYLDGVKDHKMALRIECDRNTPFQKALDVLDICKDRGFSNVSLKIKGE